VVLALPVSVVAGRKHTATTLHGMGRDEYISQLDGQPLSLKCLRPHMRTLRPNVNFAIFQLGRLLMENSRKYTSLSGSLS